MAWVGKHLKDPIPLPSSPLDQVAQGEKTEWFTLVVSSPTTSLSRMRSLYVTGAVSISYSVGLAAVCKTAGLLRKPYSGSERY